MEIGINALPGDPHPCFFWYKNRKNTLTNVTCFMAQTVFRRLLENLYSGAIFSACYCCVLVQNIETLVLFIQNVRYLSWNFVARAVN